MKPRPSCVCVSVFCDLQVHDVENAAVAILTYLNAEPNNAAELEVRLNAYLQGLGLKREELQPREPRQIPFDQASVNTVDLMTNDVAFLTKFNQMMQAYMVSEERCRGRCLFSNATTSGGATHYYDVYDQLLRCYDRCQSVTIGDLTDTNFKLPDMLALWKATMQKLEYQDEAGVLWTTLQFYINQLESKWDYEAKVLAVTSARKNGGDITLACDQLTELYVTRLGVGREAPCR